MDDRISNVCADVNACDCTQGCTDTEKSPHWKWTLGEKSLAVLRDQTCVGSMLVRHSTNWATSPVNRSLRQQHAYPQRKVMWSLPFPCPHSSSRRGPGRRSPVRFRKTGWPTPCPLCSPWTAPTTAVMFWRKSSVIQNNYQQNTQIF